MAGDPTPQTSVQDQRLKRNLRGRPKPTNTIIESKTLPQAPTPSLCQSVKDLRCATASENSDEVHKHLRSSLVKVKQARTDMKKKGVVYKVPCKDCPCVYIGETGRTLEKSLSEHRTAVKKNDPKIKIAVHAWVNQHHTSQLGRRFSHARGGWLLGRRVFHIHSP